MKNLIIAMIAVLFTAGCSDYLELQPTDKVTAENVFASEAGIEAFLANLYRNMPIEDFNCTPEEGMNHIPGSGGNIGLYEYIITDDGMGSQLNVVGGTYDWWEAGYRFNKDVNLFFSYLPALASIGKSSLDLLYGEAYFMRAYTYYALAKRYGGVPIIASIAEVSDTQALYVPRSTEKETWDFALAACDSAVMFLGDGDGKRRRVTKWVALALKSRVALHAASVAKYWNEAPLSGRAVDEKLVGGMTQEDAIYYYEQCIDAAAQIMDAGVFSLYKPSPASAEEAAENYRLMFEYPNNALEEVIFLKGFDRVGAGYGSQQDSWGNPMQTTGAWPFPGKFNPTLDLVDTYESYSSPGHSSPIVTTTDGNTDNYSGYNPSRTYLTFDDPQDIFKDKDARMHGTVIIPNSIWKNTQIIIQGGYIQPDGTALIEGSGEIEVNGVTYYTYGAALPMFYSGFDTYGGNMTRTGFGFKKFLSTTFVPILGWSYSTTDYIDFRYAEVLLNYAEAVAESGRGDRTKAAKAINDLRKRAAHKSDIPLTLDNVFRERRVELVYESKRHWDLVRRREYHKKFNNTQKTALVPVLDLRNMKYIFIRQYVTGTYPLTYVTRSYYSSIPGTATNRLVQNPQY
ncbi:MAG: RagB/SusD family nutrient uptake outer membrane protein [Tannerella sp.]|nr:RagB/SusD family nutrient uptake outer membrane protein [Tannerella sp.]